MTNILLPLVLTIAIVAFGQTDQASVTANHLSNGCVEGDPNIIDIPIAFSWLNANCVRLQGGFSDKGGSFVRASYSRHGLLHLGELLTLDGEYGVRLHRARFGFEKTSLLGKPIELTASVYGQRFNYNQGVESSIFAWHRNIAEFSTFNPDDLLNYVSYARGVTASAKYRLGSHWKAGLEYRYDLSDISPQTEATAEYFSYINFRGVFPANGLNGIQTSMVIPTFSYDTVDNARSPTRGTAVLILTAIAGLAGDVSTVEPAFDVKYFHPGFSQSHVIALHLSGRMITGYGGSAVPPFDRYYIGGESSVRGFDSWSISPIAYIPTAATVNVFNSDGSPRTKKGVDVTMSVPAYRPVSVGGDTSLVANAEYRISMRGPLTIVLFTDAGLNRATFQDQLQVNAGSIAVLNGEFPQAGLSARSYVQPGTQKIRVSAGPELQVRVPKIDAPLRFYLAYNPSAYRDVIQAPGVADRAYFPNTATYLNALSVLDANVPLRERLWTVRFSISRTF